MSPNPRFRRPHVVPITAPSFPTMPRPRLYKNIAYTFVALAVLIVGGVLWLSSVRAEIVVKAKQTGVQLDSTADISKNPQTGQLTGRVVQGVYEKIQEFHVADLEAASTSSTANGSSSNADQTPTSAPIELTQNNPNVLARGTVRIVNRYSKAQTLVRTTRLLTPDQKLYRIDKTVVVPSGGEVSVAAYADQPGSEFVIGPSRFIIPGLFVDLQKYIYAVSDATFTVVPYTPPLGKTVPSKPFPRVVAPSVHTGKIITAADIDQAEKMLTDAVLEQAKQALATEVSDAHLDQAVYFVKLLDKKANVSPGQTGDAFLASVKLDVTAVYYPKQDMLALIHSKLKQKIPDGRELAPFADTDIVYTLQLADAKSETATLRATVTARYRLTTASPALDRSLIAGKSKDDAMTLIKSAEGVDDVQIVLHPSWFSKLPTLKDHIELKVE